MQAPARRCIVRQQAVNSLHACRPPLAPNYGGLIADSSAFPMKSFDSIVNRRWVYAYRRF